MFVHLLKSAVPVDGGSSIDGSMGDSYTGEWGWLHRFADGVRAADAIKQRSPFQPDMTRTASTLPLTVSESVRKPRETLGQPYLDNMQFTMEQDAQIVKWFSSRPQDLVHGTAGTAMVPLRVLVAAFDRLVCMEDVRKKLAIGHGFTADICDLSAQSLSVPLLRKYDVVMVWTESASRLPHTGVFDAAVNGSALAQYVDDGGRVLQCFTATPLLGTWSTGSYMPVAVTGETTLTSARATDTLRTHAISTNVTQFNAARISIHTCTAMDGAAVLAHWPGTAHHILLAQTSRGKGRVHFLNMYPPSADAAPDVLTDRQRAEQHLLAALHMTAARGRAMDDGDDDDGGEDDDDDGMLQAAIAAETRAKSHGSFVLGSEESDGNESDASTDDASSREGSDDDASMDDDMDPDLAAALALSRLDHPHRADHSGGEGDDGSAEWEDVDENASADMGPRTGHYDVTVWN